ncbi:MAG TPA: MFS transporter [Ktedonobacterales bacterium]|nr:MFS transporter [Ktedonobacterales bacterium]
MPLSTDAAPETGAPDFQASTAPESTSPRRRGLSVGPLRVRNFRLLIGGQAVSTVGDMLYAVALPWFMLSGGGSARDLGIVLAAYGIPRAGSVLLGGMLSDRIQPRRIMLLADIARALLLGGLAAIVLLNLHTLWILCAIGAPLGLFEGIFLPASAAILPGILDDDDLQAGNAINMATVQVATLAGPSAGGAIVASVRSGIAFAIDAITFVISALALAGMRGKRAPVAATPADVATADVATADIVVSPETSTDAADEGAEQEPKTFWGLLRTSRLLQVGLTVSIVANLAFGGLVEVALPDLAHGPLHAGATGFGLMLSTFGGGALAGSLIGATLGKLPRRGLIALLLSFAQGIFVAITPFTGGLLGAAISMGVWGLVNAMSNVLLITLLQQKMPRALLGRVMGAFMFANFGLYPISVALGGVVVDRFGPAILFPITGIMLSGAILYGIFQRELRDL